MCPDPLILRFMLCSPASLTWSDVCLLIKFQCFGFIFFSLLLLIEIFCRGRDYVAHDRLLTNVNRARIWSIVNFIVSRKKNVNVAIWMSNEFQTEMQFNARRLVDQPILKYGIAIYLLLFLSLFSKCSKKYKQTNHFRECLHCFNGHSNDKCHTSAIHDSTSTCTNRKHMHKSIYKFCYRSPIEQINWMKCHSSASTNANVPNLHRVRFIPKHFKFMRSAIRTHSLCGHETRLSREQ